MARPSARLTTSAATTARRVLVFCDRARRRSKATTTCDVRVASAAGLSTEEGCAVHTLPFGWRIWRVAAFPQESPGRLRPFCPARGRSGLSTGPGRPDPAACFSGVRPSCPWGEGRPARLACSTVLAWTDQGAARVRPDPTVTSPAQIRP